MSDIDIFINAAPIDIEISAAQGPAGTGGGGGSSAWADITGKPSWTGTFDGTYGSLTGSPTLGGAAALNVGTTAGTVAAGNHTHAQLHDAVTVTGNGISLSGQQLSLSIGTGSTQVAAGDHTHTASGLDFSATTDIGADLADADEIMVSDGGGNTTRRKSAMSRVWDYIKAKIDAGQTWSGAQVFDSTTRPTSAGTGTPASNSLITLADAMSYSDNYFPMVATFSASGSGHSITSGPCNTTLGWSASPTAGGSYLVANANNVPHILAPGIDYDWATGSGYGGLIDMGANFLFSFSFFGKNTAADVIFRLAVGRSSTIASGVMGACLHGFGVRMNKKAGSSGTYELRLCGTAGSYANSTITAATNTTPIVITNANHNLVDGDTVEVTGCVGNTAANGIFSVTNVTPSTFTLVGSVGNGTWTSGGAVQKITAPIDVTAGQNLRVFLSNKWATTGTVELRVGSLRSAPMLTLSGLNPVPRSNANAAVGQQSPLRLGLQSVTDATPYLPWHIGNMYFQKL